MKILYVVLTKNCPLNCPFCFNTFVENFKKCSTTPLDKEEIIKTIEELDPDVVSYIGGEPLLYPKEIKYVLNYFDIRDTNNHRNRIWCISTNLYYKQLADEQIEVLQLMQNMSIEEVTIGTSYTVDRFDDVYGYEEMFKNNMLFLDSIGINMGVTVTLTKEQIENMNPVKLKWNLEELKYKAVNLERCIYPHPKNDQEEYELQELYKKMDLYLRDCFSIFPEDKNYQYKRYKDSVLYEVPVFNPHCSKEVYSLYEHGLYKGCPLNSSYNKNGIDVNKEYMEKIKKFNCLECKYFKYCRGDCECTRGMCAFPKNTIEYLIDFKEEY